MKSPSNFISDKEWGERVARKLKPGMCMSSLGGGLIRLIKSAPRSGDPATHGPVWWVKPILPCSPKCTAYVAYFDVVPAKEADHG